MKGYTYIGENLIYKDITHLREKIEQRDQISKRLKDIYINNNSIFNTINFENILKIRNKRDITSKVESNITLCRQVRSKCIELIGYDLDSNDKKTIEDGDTAEILARYICESLTKEKDNKYLYGTIDNIKKNPSLYKEMIFWIIRDISLNIKI